MRSRLLVRDTLSELWTALAGAWRESAHAAVGAHGWFAAALSGGQTPEGFYRHLSREAGLPWRRTHLYLADERLVAPDDPESNGRLIRASLLDGLAEAPAGVHFPRTDEADATKAAAAYEQQMREVFAELGMSLPALDLVLLGIGTDGHTASLFPGSSALEERTRLVAGVPATAQRRARVTLTLPFINAARRVIVLATGAGKRAVLARVLGDGGELPAARLGPAGGELEFYVDREACPGPAGARDNARGCSGGGPAS